MMYEDIVASTQPLNYNPSFLRKFDYESGFSYHGRAAEPFRPPFADFGDDSFILGDEEGDENFGGEEDLNNL